MTSCRISACSLAMILFVAAPAAAQGQTAKPTPPKADDKLPFCKLAPSKIASDLCLVRYRITTQSPECQAFFDQGLGYFYSYVWMEAARSFETAVKADPECAMAWWGLSRALERYGRGDATKALLKADELDKAKASYSEQQLILARMQEKGQAPNVGDSEARKRAAVATLDNLLALHDDDEEAWYYRAQLAGGSGLFGGQASSVPFYKALLKVNVLHPGANHELVHYYENCRRPALGWVYAENYIKSSPGIPHPFHMQAHLATRIGRWDKTCDRSSRAIELEQAYHKFMDVKPSEDHQYIHHLEILTLSLIHDGRFREARQMKEEALKNGMKYCGPWCRMHLCERDWDEAAKVIEMQRKNDKSMASYLAAMMYLRKHDVARATAEVEVLQQAQRDRKNDKQLEGRLWETQGWLMCQSGAPDQGLKLLQKLVDRTKNDYGHHAWGNGAVYMETWGIAALQAGKLDVAEEAFLEALAHDPGSVHGAIGMQVLCERQGRLEEAKHFADLAQRRWRRAEVKDFMAELSWLRGSVLTVRNEAADGKPGYHDAVAKPAAAKVIPQQ